jgi:HlyD family secretion protein
MKTESHDKDSNNKLKSEKAKKFMELIKQSKNPGSIPEEIEKSLTEEILRSYEEQKKSKVTSPQTELNVKDGDSLPDISLEEIHSVEVQEILGYIPNWIIRWGITVVVGTIFLLLLGSWFVKYPDIITAKIDITTQNPPVYLKAQSGGKLKHLLVSDNQKVSQGQYLAVLETTSDYVHVLEVKGQLEILRQKLSSTSAYILADLAFNPNNLLGEQQTDYKNFLNSYREYLQFYDYKYFESKLNSLRDQLQNTKQKNSLLTNQLQTLQEEYDLIMRQYERTKTLYEKNLVSTGEWENARGTLLQEQYGLDIMKISLTDADLRVNQLEQSIMELEHDSLQMENKLRGNLMQTCDRLLSQIMYWEQRFVIKASINGVASLGHYWSEDQNVDVGDNILSVIPEKISELLGRIELPLQGSGKVRIGQKVNIKFINYPHTEYGIVRGVIKSKSMIPEDDNYILTVYFPDNLVTNYGYNLPFGQKMKGDAEIITDDLRFLERIFSKARSYLSR